MSRSSGHATNWQAPALGEARDTATGHLARKGGRVHVWYATDWLWVERPPERWAPRWLSRYGRFVPAVVAAAGGVVLIGLGLGLLLWGYIDGVGPLLGLAIALVMGPVLVLAARAEWRHAVAGATRSLGLSTTSGVSIAGHVHSWDEVEGLRFLQASGVGSVSSLPVPDTRWYLEVRSRGHRHRVRVANRPHDRLETVRWVAKLHRLVEGRLPDSIEMTTPPRSGFRFWPPDA